MKPPFTPRRILLLKSHSAGIGDLLRSSAAWRVLKNAWPEAELHLFFLTREPGYPSEELIREHHLLSSFTSVDKRTPTLREWFRFWAQVRKAVAAAHPDLVIDFEPNGLRTSLVAFWAACRCGARTVGINSVPGRGLLYGRAAAPLPKYLARHNIPAPPEYTEHDFVALAALGLERNGCAIELRETEAGRKFRESLRGNFGIEENEPLLGLNIGCGTPGAGYKRPDLKLLSDFAGPLQRDHRMRLVLTGAPFESAINQEFIALHRQNWPGEPLDLAGKTNMSELTGVLNAFTLYVSPDSGPYHMAVALRVPTLVIFNHPWPASHHNHPWVRHRLLSTNDEPPILRQLAEELLAWKRSQQKSLVI